MTRPPKASKNSPNTDLISKIICHDVCVFVQIGSLYEAFVLKMVLMRDLFFYGLFGSKVWSEIKETTFQVGHFTTISGHSTANYINIFHKTEVPTVILRCLMSLNPNWIKSYNINYKLFWQLYFSILEEKKLLKWPFFDHLWSFFGNYIDIFHKTEIQTVILRRLLCSIY
jgi:hypothetical protein